ncbi:UDP-glucoronosyl and UDP-glucosyl transferase [Ancylostoma caninum]|uniref:glucuronosyltransferase n=1 Tax=Ancylostoma caninum TaxID=29170 RepID=A0A368FWF5_ANCCA|nr:UDP-glucoronosyl and UDP-glucosyl transferase [Ancylostoma caninum]
MNKDLKEQESKQDSFRSIWTTPSSAVAMLQITKKMSEIFKWQCETLINDDALLQRLREEKFDLGIAEPNTVCALGLFEVLDMKSTIAVVSNPHLESVAFAIGEPFLPSYIPGLFSSTGDKMTFLERLENIFALTVAKIFGSYCYNAEMEVFIKKFGSFKDYNELIAQVSFVFTNGNPYLDFPRPTLHKTVMIGGFAVAQREKEKQQLSQKWNSILNVRKRTVLVSFGSYARSVDMPEDFKRAMLDVFASMPDVTFIWKYEDENSNIADSLPNVYLSSWVPQVELLEDERLSLFLTHGGLASTNEVAFMGKPAIVAPILGDQVRNSRMLARHGGALVFDKSNLNDAKKLKDTFDEVLNNPEYSQKRRIFGNE